MKKIIWLLLMLPISVKAQNADSLMLRTISDEILLKGKSYDDLRELCKNIGHRLSGSNEAAMAVRWAEKKLMKLGADEVWLQPVKVPVWVRGDEKLKVQFTPGESFENVNMLSLGNSQGTDGKMVEAEVIMAKDLAAFQKLKPADVKGKIVFFNYRFNQEIIRPFEGYGKAVFFRGHAANLAASKGAVGAIIRSVSTGEDDYPHTGSMRYADSVKAKLPVVAIGNTSANKLEAALGKNKVKVQLTSNCKMQEDVMSHNVIADLKGAVHPDKIILIGAHIDSWDVGEGAHDDGAGIVQIIEVLRTFKAMGWKPYYTLRLVCFMNEENGLRGAIAYADSAKAKNEPHLLAIESDAGGFAPRGFGLKTKDISLKNKVQKLMPALAYLGIHHWQDDESGADLIPLEGYCKMVSGFLPDPQRYFDIHHAPSDVFENVNHRELKLGAAAIAGLVYLVNTHKTFD